MTAVAVDPMPLPALREQGVVAARNPIAKLAAAAIIAVGLVASLDTVSAAVALALEVPLFLAAGLGWRRFWRRTAVVWIAAPLAALTIALYGRTDGTVHWEWLLIRVSDGSLDLALATGVRLLAVALPSVVLFATVDPTDLADGLGQVLRMPARFVLGALAGLRLLSVLRDDQRTLALARRARGVADRGRLRRFAGMAFGILVVALRRGSALATTMEARGFGGPTRRTWARPSRVDARDLLLVLAAVAIVAGAITAAVVAGTWRFVVG